MLFQNKYFLIIPVLAFAISCNKIEHTDPVPPPSCQPVESGDTCDYWTPSGGLISISGPVSASIGQSVQLTVSISGNSGCSDAAQIFATVTGNNISLTGSVHYHGCICTAVMTEETGIYSFTPTQAGTYTIHGETYDGTPVVHTLVVQ